MMAIVVGVVVYNTSMEMCNDGGEMLDTVEEEGKVIDHSHSCGMQQLY